MSSNKRRDCPALGKTITPADCGAQRHSRIRCSEVCPFNPFAPGRDEALLEVDATAVGKWIARMRRDPVGLPPGFVQHGEDATIKLHDCIRLLRHTRTLRDAHGLTFWQRWEKARWEGLRNDEQVILQRVVSARFRLLEVRALREGGVLFEAVDQWDPAAGRLLVAGERLWPEINRFDSILALLPEFPHYHWANFGAIQMAAPAQQSAGARVDLVMGHLGCPADREARQLWLEENLGRVDEALCAVAQVEDAASRRSREPTRLVTALYAFDPPERSGTLTELLRARPDCGEEPDVFDSAGANAVEFGVEDTRPPLPLPAGGLALLGRVRVRGGTLELRAKGHLRLTRLRDWLREAAGQPDWLRQTHFPDPTPFAPFLSERQKTLIPPGLVVDARTDPLCGVEYRVLIHGPHQGEFKRLLREARWNWSLNQPLDRLDGRSVAQALGDPQARAQILEWGKHQVNSADIQEGDVAFELERRLRDLGLVELLEPLPPPRPSRLPEPPEQEWENSVREALGEDADEEWLDDPAWDEEDEWEDDGAGNPERPRQTTPPEIHAVAARLRAGEDGALRRKAAFSDGFVFEVYYSFYPFGQEASYDCQVEDALPALMLVAFPDGEEPKALQRGRLFRYAEEEFARITDVLNRLPPGGDVPDETLDTLSASALDKELGKYAFELLWHINGLGAEHREEPGPQIYALAFAFGLIREIAHHRPPEQGSGGNGVVE